MKEITQDPLEQTLRTQSVQTETVPLRYCLYARKSTESDEKQALSIESQVNEMLGIAKRDGLEVIDIQRESFSSKEAGKRPIFNQMLSDIRIGKFNGILTWAPDRLSRNAGDLGAIVDLLDKNTLMEVRTYGQTFTNLPNEKFLLMILGSQAKLENDQKGVNVKRGLRTRCEQGLWPGPAPTGYYNYNQKDRLCEVYVDTVRAPVVRQIFERVAYEGMSGRDIVAWLRNEVKFVSVQGKSLVLSSVYKILNTPFYYGEFEYPKGSGNWYKGKHKPLISKELFIRAQEKLKENRTGTRTKRNNWAFTRLMKCGHCGSGVTAQDKYKHQKNGVTRHYIYYSCTRAKDIYCKSKFITEEKVIEQIAQIIDKLDLNKVSLGDKIEKEIGRFSHFQSKVLGMEEVETKKKHEVDIKNYAKYLLEEGTIVEKREILENLKSKLILKNKEIILV